MVWADQFDEHEADLEIFCFVLLFSISVEKVFLLSVILYIFISHSHYPVILFVSLYYSHLINFVSLLCHTVSFRMINILSIHSSSSHIWKPSFAEIEIYTMFIVYWGYTISSCSHLIYLDRIKLNKSTVWKGKTNDLQPFITNNTWSHYI